MPRGPVFYHEVLGFDLESGKNVEIFLDYHRNQNHSTRSKSGGGVLICRWDEHIQPILLIKRNSCI